MSIQEVLKRRASLVNDDFRFTGTLSVCEISRRIESAPLWLKGVDFLSR